MTGDVIRLMAACALLSAALAPDRVAAWGAGGGGGPSASPGDAGYFTPSKLPPKDDQVIGPAPPPEKSINELYDDLKRAKERIGKADAELQDLRKDVLEVQDKEQTDKLNKARDQALKDYNDISAKIWDRGKGIEVTINEVLDGLRTAQKELDNIPFNTGRIGKALK
jgi:vacuolar-type H+-ATPase subunit H